MQSINIKLKAKNSSGDQNFWLTHADGEYWFTLCGDYKGDKIQIDFEDMTRAELEDLKAMIDLLLHCT